MEILGDVIREAHPVYWVANLERSVAFYRDVLGLEEAWNFRLFFIFADEDFLKRRLNFCFFNGLAELLKEREAEPCMFTEFGSSSASPGMSSPRSA